MIASGSTLANAARSVGHAADVISVKLRATGFEIPKPKTRSRLRTDIDAEGIAEAFQRGASANQLAKQHGTSRILINRVLREAGLSNRTPSEAAHLAYASMSLEKRQEITATAREGRRMALSNLESVHIGPGEDEFFTESMFNRQTIVGPFVADGSIGWLAVELKQRRTLAFKGGDERRLEFFHRLGYSMAFIVFDEVASLIHLRSQITAICFGMSFAGKHARKTATIYASKACPTNLTRSGATVIYNDGVHLLLVNHQT